MKPLDERLEPSTPASWTTGPMRWKLRRSARSLKIIGVTLVSVSAPHVVTFVVAWSEWYVNSRNSVSLGSDSRVMFTMPDNPVAVI
jgi:hypothetical protein